MIRPFTKNNPGWKTSTSESLICVMDKVIVLLEFAISKHILFVPIDWPDP